MKLYIEHELGDSGKGKFLRRLIPELEKLGTVIVEKASLADIAMGVGRWHDKIKCPKVLRVDGIHLQKSKRNIWLNSEIRLSIKHSNAVIFQTNFSKRMACELFGVDPKCRVIFNGADPKKYEESGLRNKGKFDDIVIISGKWYSREIRQHKRLKEMIQVAHDYTATHKETLFLVAGAIEEEFKWTENVMKLGRLDDVMLSMHLATADIMLNLAWYDWCPNAVVEAMVAGNPVVCTTGGGVQEIVNGYGTCLELDNPPKPKLIDSLKPPKIDLVKVCEAIEAELKFKRRIEPKHLYISEIARQYHKFFEDVLNGNI